MFVGVEAADEQTKSVCTRVRFVTPENSDTNTDAVPSEKVGSDGGSTPPASHVAGRLASRQPRVGISESAAGGITPSSTTEAEQRTSPEVATTRARPWATPLTGMMTSSRKAAVPAVPNVTV
jgi:hypothetical protein